jgi:tetratricopeptide (TPR) repeat protein
MAPKQRKKVMGTKYWPRLAAMLCLAISGAVAHAQGSDAEVSFNAGLEHLRQGHPAQALEEMRRATKQEPKNAYFQKGLGQAHLQLGQSAEAIAAFRKALEINPNYVDARNDLGVALLLAGQREEGKRELLKVFGEPFNPRPDITARNIGQAYFDEKNYTDALTWFQTSAQKNRRFSEGYIGISATLVALGRLDEAITQLEEGLSATSENVDVLFALGDTYYRAGRFAEARTRLERVVQKDAAGPSGQRATELLKKFPR